MVVGDVRARVGERVTSADDGSKNSIYVSDPIGYIIFSSSPQAMKAQRRKNPHMAQKPKAPLKTNKTETTKPSGRKTPKRFPPGKDGKNKVPARLRTKTGKRRNVSSQKTVKQEAKKAETKEEAAERQATALATKAKKSSPHVPGKIGGRRALFELIEPITDDCVRTLKDIMLDDDVLPGVRMEAATRLLDRGYGKPKEQAMDQGEDGSKTQTALEQLKKLREEIGKIEDPE